MKTVLTIAGSDSGGGAGIQADLKSFSARGVFGMSAITALTAQNTLGVQGVLEIDPSFVEQQIDSVMADMGADAWKTGMLANAAIIQSVAERARKYHISKLVVDPVMMARGGHSLLKPNAVSLYISDLFPLTLIVTPNCEEAGALTDISIKTIFDMRSAAELLKEMGPKYVLIKGGHFENSDIAVDVLYDGGNFTEFESKRVVTKNTHGTGCTFASAIAAEIAKGKPIVEAIHIAKAYLTAAILGADKMKIGTGNGPTDHIQGTITDVDLDLVSVK